ncbi:MAG: hypothetical protein ACJ76K_01450 [Solirubrobacteraceae bacterium]
MPLRVVLIGGVVALLAGIAIVLSQSGHELTGTNGAKREQFVAVLHGGQRACQPNTTVPAGTGRFGLEVGTYGRRGPPLVVSVGPVSATLNAGWQEGTIAVPFSPAVARPVTGTLCVRNAGRRQRIAVAGSQGTPSVYYEASDKTTWWSRIGDLPRRMEFLGSWAFWLALVLSACGVVLALVAMLRSDRDPAG